MSFIIKTLKGGSLSFDQRRSFCVLINANHSLPIKKVDIHAGSSFLLYNVLTEDECNNLIKSSEGMGYQAAIVNMGGNVGEVMNTRVRNNDRIVYENAVLANQLWTRIKPFIPETFEGEHATRLNNRFRFYKYSENQRFVPHLDGRVKLDGGETSQLTVLFYLNQSCKGGTTTIFKNIDYHSPREVLMEVTPTTGSVLVFAHRTLHEGKPVEEGLKYVLRSDVFYKK